jgi:(R,R)-butanediol dehydrogenase/meso-butanediol dehydrogenase/diacetyl reductase
MFAVRLHGPGDFRLEEIEEPIAGPDDVVVQVKACGICGSDLSYVATGGVSGPVSEPIGLGHELSGVIDTVGEHVVDLQPGMRVVINPMGGGNAIGNGAAEGAFAPRLLVRNARRGESVHPIPERLSFDRAALAEPLSVALHAVTRAQLQPQAKIAVFGAGPIGLGIVLFLKRQSFEDIVVIDMSDERLARARALGARVTLNPARDDVAQGLGEAHGRGDLFGWPVVDTGTFFEVSGAKPVIPSIIEMAPFHAKLVVVAVHHEPVPVSFLAALAKEMTITTSMAYPDEFPQVLETLLDETLDMSPLVSHSFGLNDFHDAFATAQDRDRSAKVLITFDA